MPIYCSLSHVALLPSEAQISTAYLVVTLYYERRMMRCVVNVSPHLIYIDSHFFDSAADYLWMLPKKNRDTKIRDYL